MEGRTCCILVACVLTIVQIGQSAGHPHDSDTNSQRTHLYGLDPEVDMNVTELLTSKGYPCEEYTAKTADGYLLGVQRVPHGRDNAHREYIYKTADGYLLGVQRVPHGRDIAHLGVNRPVVFLQHGLFSSADDWADNLVNQSFVFLLADAGFEVWLGNSRGNTYSLKHEKYKPTQKEFWDFSWDDMAKYDLPASVNTALQVSGASDLVYVGHSQGTQIAFAQLSTDRDLSQKIKLFVALAPIAYIGNIKSPISKLAPYAKEMQVLFDLLGVKDFLPSSPLFHWLAQNFCDEDVLDKLLCENVLFLLGGYDPQQMNASRIPVYVSHAPAGTSVKNVVHYAQLHFNSSWHPLVPPVVWSRMVSKLKCRPAVSTPNTMVKSVLADKFQKFDYGAAENQRKYNQSTPPQFDPSQITVPMALYSGPADWLADPIDVSRLVPELKTLVKHKVIPNWEHLDFIWAMDSPTACYNDIINLIKQYNNMV